MKGEFRKKLIPRRILVPIALFASLSRRGLGTAKRSEKGDGDENDHVGEKVKHWHLVSICSAEKLTLETSASLFLHGGNLTQIEILTNFYGRKVWHLVDENNNFFTALKLKKRLKVNQETTSRMFQIIVVWQDNRNTPWFFFWHFNHLRNKFSLERCYK